MKQDQNDVGKQKLRSQKVMKKVKVDCISN